MSDKQFRQIFRLVGSLAPRLFILCCITLLRLQNLFRYFYSKHLFFDSVDHAQHLVPYHSFYLYFWAFSQNYDVIETLKSNAIIVGYSDMPESDPRVTPYCRHKKTLKKQKCGNRTLFRNWRLRGSYCGISLYTGLRLSPTGGGIRTFLSGLPRKWENTEIRLPFKQNQLLGGLIPAYHSS